MLPRDIRPGMAFVRKESRELDIILKVDRAEAAADNKTIRITRLELMTSPKDGGVLAAHVREFNYSDSVNPWHSVYLHPWERL